MLKPMQILHEFNKGQNMYEIANNYNTTHSAICHKLAQARILKILPDISLAKADILSSLKTHHDIELFTNKHEIHLIDCRSLRKEIKLWNKQIQNNPMEFLTKEENEFILGTLLGDSAIRKRLKYGCLRSDHTLAQKTL